MNILSRVELRVLVDNKATPCISIYMPCQLAGQQVRQNPIRLKNLLVKAEDDLATGGMRRAAARDLVQPGHELFKDPGFVENVSAGLALFISPGMFRYYRLTVPFEELVVLGDNFHIKPLIPLFTADGRFFILALSQEKVRLFVGTRFTVREVPLKDLPAGLEEMLRSSQFDKGKQVHTTGSMVGGGRGESTGHHGQGSAGEEAVRKRILMDFLHLLEKALHKALNGERGPMVVAGVDYMRALFKETTSHPAVMAQGISGNPELLSKEQLHSQAWTIVEPYFDKAQEEALAKYRQLIGSVRVSDDIEGILNAAYAGRIETLFVSKDQHVWGRYDAQAKLLYLHKTQEPGDEDVLDLAALRTLVHNGAVYALKSDKMPTKAAGAAAWRY